MVLRDVQSASKAKTICLEFVHHYERSIDGSYSFINSVEEFDMTTWNYFGFDRYGDLKRHSMLPKDGEFVWGSAQRAIGRTSATTSQEDTELLFSVQPVELKTI